MNPHYSDDMVTLYHGDCIDVMRSLPDCSVDAVVTDPPYELGFMGKGWDASGIAYNSEVWENAYRVLKPGGHLLAFGGTRTWHRLAVAIEDAGFEIRDSIAWMYASGFPKSLDVSKAIDKRRDDAEEAAEVARFLCRHNTLGTLSEFREHLNASIVGDRHSGGSAQGWTTETTTGAVKPRVPTWKQWIALKELLQLDDAMDAEVWRLNGRKGQPGEAWAEREITGQYEQPTAQQVWMQNYSDHVALPPKERKDIPATPAAQQWQGWGTALKPAFEPIVVARKPLIGTVAENVLTHGTGALNIDGCRVGTEQILNQPGGIPNGAGNYVGTSKVRDRTVPPTTATGRWPANVILDESQAAELDKQSGGASRFFYCAKAPKRERPTSDDVAHPTVKPLTLMRYLVRLITPPAGTVLDPFAGSGTTIEAALLEGFNTIGIEREADYLPLIQQRIDRVGDQLSLL